MKAILMFLLGLSLLMGAPGAFAQGKSSKSPKSDKSQKSEKAGKSGSRSEKKGGSKKSKSDA
jgi:hypothetical protein